MNLLKHIFKFANSVKFEKYLSIMFLVHLLIFLLLLGYVVIGDKYFITYQDEANYYNCGDLFSKTYSFKATIIFSEKSSIIGQMNWYGPCYHLIYGIPAILFGFHNTLNIIVNVLIFIISLIVFWFTINDKIHSVFLFFILFSSYFLIFYSFTYYPTVLHLSFSLFLIAYLIKLEKRITVLRIFGYFTLVLAFSLFNSLFALWILGVLPLYKGKKDLLMNLFLVLILFVIIFFWTYFFNAPYYPECMKSISYLHNGKYLLFVQSVLNNFKLNLIGFLKYNFNDVPSLIVSFLFVMSFYLFLRHKEIIFNKITIIIASSYFIAIFLFYLTYPFFFNKQIVPIFPLLIIMYFRNIHEKVYIRKLLILVILFFLPYTYYSSFREIKNHKHSFYKFKNDTTLTSSFEKLRDLTNIKKDVYILFCYKEFEYYNVLLSLLPKYNCFNYPIIYSTHVIDGNESDDLKFQRLGIIKFDYILSKNKLYLEDIKLIEQNNYFYLYQIQNNN